jgi:hypothetical protein
MVKQTAYAHLPEPAGDAAETIQRERSHPKMRNDNTGEFRINLPPDVLAEMRRQAANPRSAMQVDGFRPGIFGRLLDLVTGRRR